MILPLGALGVLPLDVDSGDPAFNAVKPGWIPFLIVIALGVVLAFLFFSMKKQLRKVDFPEDKPAGQAPAAGSSGGSAPKAG